MVDATYRRRLNRPSQRMRTASGFKTVSRALVLAICVSQLWARATETGGGPDSATASASAPPPKVAASHMKIITLQPASSSAASSSAPQTPDTDSEIQEVTVRAQRLTPSIPIAERRRFYIESRSSGDPNDSLLLYENGRVCADKSLPVPSSAFRLRHDAFGW